MKAAKDIRSQVNFVVPSEDLARWKETARSQRKSLSRWIRDLCYEFGEQTSVDHPRLPDEPAPIKVTPTQPAKKIAEQLLERAKAVSAEDCLKRLPKGTYCKACGRSH